MERTHINGVPVDQFGVWCPHGVRIMVADPADSSEYPECVYVEPWPCREQDCTQQGYEAGMQEEVAAYEAERWAEYRASQ